MSNPTQPAPEQPQDDAPDEEAPAEDTPEAAPIGVTGTGGVVMPAPGREE